MTRKPSPQTAERDKQILAMLAEGLKQAEIARRLGVTRQAVHQRIEVIDRRGFGKVSEALREAAERKAGQHKKTTATAGQDS